jgi:hypothetical protein
MANIYYDSNKNVTKQILTGNKIFMERKFNKDKFSGFFDMIFTQHGKQTFPKTKIQSIFFKF